MKIDKIRLSCIMIVLMIMSFYKDMKIETVFDILMPICLILLTCFKNEDNE